MSRTRNSRPAASSFAKPSRRDHGGMLLGIFIGLVIGLGMAASVAFWLMKNNPALQSPVSANNAREPVKEPSRVAKNDVPEKPRFDFYKILPGAEETRAQSERKPAEKTDRGLVEQAKERTSPKAPDRAVETAQERAPSVVASVDPSKAAKSGDKFWLQAGSCSTESDAENLKARLAFAGWEATVQQGLLPDKVVRFRVRLGPYDNPDEMQRIKGELGKRGFEAAVIKF